MQKTELLVKNLIAKNMRPIKVEKGSNLFDPTIWFTESIYIQVSHDDVVVLRDRPTGLTAYECTSDVNDIINKVKQAINEGKPKQ